MFHHFSHIVPGLNTTSTADISFMLLIFFLVTTSMDVDKGLSRQLPPADTQKQQNETNINKSNLMALQIDAQNRLTIDDRPAKMSTLRGEVENFVTSRGKKHLITIKVDPNSNYNTYFNMQNEIVAAYNDIRNNLAIKKFGHKYDLCSQPQKDAIKSACPQRISETYNGGGAQ